MKWNGDPRGLVALRARLAEFLAAQGVSRSESHLIVLAIDEACANVAEHGYRGKGGEVDLEYEISGDRFRAMIRDRGRRCETPIPRDLDIQQHVASGKRRGLGLLILGRVMDDVARSVDAEGRNVLALERKLHDSRD